MTSIVEGDWILVTDDDVRLNPDKTVKTMSPLVNDPGLPASRPTVSSWLVPPDSLANYRSSAVLPSHVVDVVIIGSGFSGTSVAWHLLHGDDEPRTKYMSCLMLEARDICSGATGRNGGHLSCNYYAMYSHVETLYGKEEAALQSHFEKLNFDAVRELIQREGIDCEFKWDNRRGGWDIYLTDEDFEWAKRELEAMRDAGGYTSSCRVFQGEEASKAAGVKFCVGGIQTLEHASLRPYALVTGLLHILVRRHLLQLHTNTPVTSLTSPSTREKHYTVHTPRGAVKARHVVNATNGWIGHLYPEFQGIIVPTRGQVIHVDGGNLHVDPMGWHDGAEYLIQRPDTSLIFGGARRLTPNTEIGNADDTQINPQISQFLHTFLPTQFAFSNTAGTPPPIPSIREWTGIMGFSNDAHPYVGRVPGEGNKWVIGGFTGHGMPRIFLAAKALVQQLLAGERGEREEWPRWFPRGFIVRKERERSTFDMSYLSKSHH